MVIIFIESNTTGTGYLMADKASEQGFEVVVLTSDPKKYQFSAGTRVEETDTRDMSVLRRRILEINRANRVDAILSSSEYFINVAALLAKEFALPGADPIAIENCRDKYRFRRLLHEKAGTPIKYCLLRSEGELSQIGVHLEFPVVVKPRSGSGSSSVSLCRNVEELKTAVARNRDFVTRRGGDFSELGCLVEQYAIGQEYSVECFQGRVICITRKHLGPEPFFVEVGHDVNFDIDELIRSHINSEVENSLNILGLTWGPAHVELKVSGNAITFIEVNPRLAGGMIPVLVRHSLGIDLLASWLALALGEECEISATEENQGAIRFLVPESGKTLSTQLDETMLEKAAAKHLLTVGAIAEAKLYKSVGYQSHVQGDFSDRVGHLMLVAPELDYTAASEFKNTVLGEVFHA